MNAVEMLHLTELVLRLHELRLKAGSMAGVVGTCPRNFEDHIISALEKALARLDELTTSAALEKKEFWSV